MQKNDFTDKSQKNKADQALSVNLSNNAVSEEPSNVQVFYGTGQQISMFDQLTENEADVEDDKAIVQFPNINSTLQAQFQINSQAQGHFGFGGISQQDMFGG